MLVGTIDLMYRSGDPRAEVWSGYLKALEGPILATGFDLEAYATEKKLKQKIASERERMKGKPQSAALQKLP